MPPAKRRRLITTCDYCYTHKVKCDKKQPCSKCAKSGIPCKYSYHQQATSSETACITRAPRLSIDGYNRSSSIYFPRAFMPYIDSGINRVLIFKLINTLPENNVFNHGNGADSNAAEIIESFPPRSRFDELLPQYWECVHPLVPVLYRDEIEENYNRFWDDIASVDDPVFDVNYGLIILSMLFGTETSIQTRYSTPDSVVANDQLPKIFSCYELITATCGLMNRATFDFLKASVIFYFSGASYYADIFAATSTLSRLAEIIGLHRDPVLHHENPSSLSAKEIDTRRYVWNFIRLLDTVTSVQYGLSPHMILINSSTNFPSKNDYNPITKEFDGPVSPFRLFNIALFKSYLVLETVVHFLNFDFQTREERMFKTESVYQTVMSLYSDVGKIIGEMLSCQSYEPELISFLVSHVSSAVHRVFILHLSGGIDPNPFQNKIITNDSIAGIDLTDFGKNFNAKVAESCLAYKPEYSDQVVQLMLLYLYEIKQNFVKPDHLNIFIWFDKNTFPMQHIFYVLKDVLHFPDKKIVFNSLPLELHHFYLPEEMLRYSDSYDIRRYVIDSLLNAAKRLLVANDVILRETVNSLGYLRDYVWKKLDKSENHYNVDSNLALNATHLTHPPHQSPDTSQFFTEFPNQYQSFLSTMLNASGSLPTPPFNAPKPLNPADEQNPENSHDLPIVGYYGSPGLPVPPTFYPIYSSPGPQPAANGGYTYNSPSYESLSYKKLQKIMAGPSPVPLTNIQEQTEEYSSEGETP